MYPRKAIFIALDAIITPIDNNQGYHWTFHPQLPGLLRDYRAVGYSLIGLLDPSVFGLVLETSDERRALVDYLNTLLGAGTPCFDAVHLSADVADPTPIWALRQRFGLSLKASTLIATGTEHEALCANAGIGTLEWADTLLGELYPSRLQAAS